jgi:pimeloyl-ACP methyl ester carboxylesterase
MSTAPDRVPLLAAVHVPAAVISGRDDPLLSYLGGIATANALPEADLHVFRGMAHQIKPELWDDYVRIIVRTVGRAA